MECEGEERFQDLGEKAQDWSQGPRGALSPRAFFFGVSLLCGPWDSFSARAHFCSRAGAPARPENKVFPSVHEIPGRLF
jgi:hypothetical protein